MQKGSAAFLRQEAYAAGFGNLDIISFSIASDGFKELHSEGLTVIPTNSSSKWLYGLNAREIAKTLPRPDVVTTQDPFETGLAALNIAKKFGVPLHVQIHTDFLSPAYSNESFVNSLRVRIAKRVLPKAARVRVVSKRIAWSLLEEKIRLRANPTVLPIYPDLDRIRTFTPQPGLKAKFLRYKKRLLVVSRLEKEKNVSLAIEAFARLGKDDVCLIVVGDGSELSELEHLANRLGVAERIFFEKGAEAAPYFSLADVLLVTSRYEGYGLVIIEALGMGKPVISTDVGVAKEAGAIIADEGTFAAALANWFQNGPFEGHLYHHPYASFEEYVRAYCDDIKACLPHAPK
jgi:glycosyltransferase involved in cell wall biosynthesis